CRAMHQALRLAWGLVQVSNPGVAGMVRVDSEVYRALQLLVRTDVAKGFTLRKRATSLDLQGCDCHTVPPSPSPPSVPGERRLAKGRGRGFECSVAHMIGATTPGGTR